MRIDQLEREEVEGKNTPIDSTTEADIDIDLGFHVAPKPKKSSSVPKHRQIKRWTSRQVAQKLLQAAEMQAGVMLYPYQRNFAFRVIVSVIENDGETLSVLFSRQMGKTEAIAIVVNGLMTLLPKLGELPNAQDFLPESMFDQYGRYMYRDGFWVGVFAPSKDQAITTYDRIRTRMMSKDSLEMLRDPEFRYTVDVNNGNTCALSNGSLVRCHTASETANIESKTYHFLIIEESQDISDFKMNKSIAPMAASTNGTKVMIGTANNRKGFFYNQILVNKKREAAGDGKFHYEYDYRVGAKYNRQYAKYVKQEMDRIGYDSDEFKMAYRLIWILERGMFITEDEFVGNADNNPREYNKCAQPYEIIDEPLPRKCYVAGLDVAKDSDQTVLTILEVDYDHPVLIERSLSASAEVQVFKQYEKRIASWMTLQGNWELQFGAIKDYLEHWGILVLYMDSTGVGDPLYDRLCANLTDTMIVGYKFSIPSKSVMWKNLSQEMAAGRFFFPYGEKARRDIRLRTFIHEFTNLEKGWSGQYMVCQHPNLKNAHDDFCDSAALACLAAQEEGMIELEVGDNPFMRR